MIEDQLEQIELKANIEIKAKESLSKQIRGFKDINDHSRELLIAMWTLGYTESRIEVNGQLIRLKEKTRTYTVLVILALLFIIDTIA